AGPRPRARGRAGPARRAGRRPRIAALCAAAIQPGGGAGVSSVRTLIRFTAGYFVPCTAFAIVLFCVLPLSLGFATQAFFDALTGDGALGVWTVGAVLVSLQLSQVVTAVAISRAWSGFSYKTHALLQRNMFAGILRGFGAHCLTVP